ncbi:MAG: CPBP family glutamic-type intramembrane protease [Candidatus Muirbacterium halophilum]|nr:CPBP family glutamic-type intramembrane protease [Candidatus Muirbacterium halophilum]MCK9477090.1 CPBP family glutamic-type intramembrane protease [Candidatus Muirbacterium halophilum]
MNFEKTIKTIAIICFYLLLFILARAGLSQVPRYILGFVFDFICFYIFKKELIDKFKEELHDFKINVWLGVKLIFITYFVSSLFLFILFYFMGNNEEYARLIYKGSRITIFTIFTDILIFPIIEEIFYRFILYNYLKDKIKHNIIIIFLISFLFSIVHIHTKLRLFFWSLFVTYIYSKTKKLTVVITFHILTVVISYILMYYFVEINI